MNNTNKEPNLNDIEDYNNKDSKQKRKTVKLVIVICLVVGAFFAYLKSTSTPDDYIGTPENPGITMDKK